MDKVKKVLVVEDNDDIRDIIEILLKEENYHVCSCADVASFHKNIFESHPDLVILDVMLPDGNGIDLCCEVKADFRTEHIPVLMMSAHSNLSNIREHCQADDFIHKPFDIYRFLHKVKQCMPN